MRRDSSSALLLLDFGHFYEAVKNGQSPVIEEPTLIKPNLYYSMSKKRAHLDSFVYN